MHCAPVLFAAKFDVSAWHDLFVMAGGATAALAGLIFVAVSLNQEHIMSNRAFPSIAGNTLAMLVGSLILSVFVLTPDQPMTHLGVESLVLGACVFVFVMTSIFLTSRAAGLAWRLLRFTIGAIATLPLVVGGAMLTSHNGSGMYLLMTQIICSVIVSVYWGWILLVEVRRRSLNSE